MADYRELGIEIPDPLNLNEHVEQWRNGMPKSSGFQLIVDMARLHQFYEEPSWKHLLSALAAARDLENDVLFEASLRNPEAMARDTLKGEFDTLLQKLPPLEAKRYSHIFTTEGQRTEFKNAGISEDILKVLLHDNINWGYLRTNRDGRFDLEITTGSLSIRNHASTVRIVLDVPKNNGSFVDQTSFGVYASQYPFESNGTNSRASEDKPHLTLAEGALEGLGRQFHGYNNPPDLYTIGRKYHLASSLVAVASNMTDHYLESLAPYSHQSA